MTRQQIGQIGSILAIFVMLALPSSIAVAHSPAGTASASKVHIPAGAEGWHPPVQAMWPGISAPITVSLTGGPAAMSGTVIFHVALAATADGVAISRFLQATRGIDLLVTSADGKLQRPAEAMMGSPPPPPLEPNALIRVVLGKPMVVTVREETKAIFPGPGIYQVQALVTLFDPLTEPGRHDRDISSPITVTVAP